MHEPLHFFHIPSSVPVTYTYGMQLIIFPVSSKILCLNSILEFNYFISAYWFSGIPDESPMLYYVVVGMLLSCLNITSSVSYMCIN